MHPRGMLGKHHTPDAKERISAGIRKRRINHVVVGVEYVKGTRDVYDMRVPGADNFIANGMVVHNSGKSWIFDGPVWVLFDRCIRPDYAGDDVIRLGSKGGAEGGVELERDDGSRMKITRYRKHKEFKNLVRLEVNGKDITCGTNLETNAAIIRELVTFNAAMNSSFFGARDDVKRFYAATDTERKAIMERIFSLEDYGLAAAAAKLDGNSLVGDLTALRLRVQQLEAEIEAKRSYIDGLSTELNVDDLRNRVLMLRGAQLVVAGRLVEAVRLKDERQLALDKARREYAVRLAEYKVALTDYQGYQKEQREAIAAAQKSLDGLVFKLEHLQEKRSAVAESEDGECSACAQMVTAKSRKVVLERYDLLIRSASAHCDAASMELKMAQDKYPDRAEPVKPEFNPMELQGELTAAILAHDECVDNGKELARQRQEITAELSRGTDRVSVADGEIKESEAVMAAAREQIKDKERRLAGAELWVEAIR